MKKLALILAALLTITFAASAEPRWVDVGSYKGNAVYANEEIMQITDNKMMECDIKYEYATLHPNDHRGISYCVAHIEIFDVDPILCTGKYFITSYKLYDINDKLIDHFEDEHNAHDWLPCGIYKNGSLDNNTYDNVIMGIQERFAHL